MSNAAFLKFIRSYRRTFTLTLLALVTGLQGLKAQLGEIPQLPAITASEAKDGMVAQIGDEKLHLTVCGDSVIHVVASPEAASSATPAQPWMLDRSESCPGAPFTFKSSGDEATIETAKLKIGFSLKRGNLTYTAIGGGRAPRRKRCDPAHL